MIILIILCWIAVALIYLIQFQIVRDYKPTFIQPDYTRGNEYFDWSAILAISPYTRDCTIERESIFKYPFFKRLRQ